MKSSVKSKSTIGRSRARSTAIVLPDRPKGLRCKYAAVVDPVFAVHANDDEAVIELFDVIGEFGVTPETVSAALREVGNRPVTFKVNSPGGDVFDGITIHNQILQHPAPVKAEVLGIAASAASVAIMGADTIEIALNAQIMIHNSWVIAAGDRHILSRAVDVLSKIDASLAKIYAKRTGKKVADIIALMDDETFFDAEETVEMGFADSMLSEDGTPKPDARMTRRQIEASLRFGGLGKAAAEKVLAGGWKGLGGDPVSFAIETLAARVEGATSELKAGHRI